MDFLLFNWLALAFSIDFDDVTKSRPVVLDLRHRLEGKQDQKNHTKMTEQGNGTKKITQRMTGQGNGIKKITQRMTGKGNRTHTQKSHKG